MNNYIDSQSRIKKNEQEKKLMEWLAETKKTSTVKKEAKSKKDMYVIRRELIEYRRVKANEKNIPPFYIFTNEELDKMLMAAPKTYSDLSAAMILPDVKLKLHGPEIIKIFNS